MMRELVRKSRTYRRFHEEKAVFRETLTGLIELARFMPSASNRQPLKYVLVYTPERNGDVFPCLAFARHLKDWKGPAEGERPAAYILILGDREIAESVPWDHAIAAQTIALGAAEIGLGACIIASINRRRLKTALTIPSRYRILLVVALGYPRETVVLEEMKGGNSDYWRDENDVHHVPKRSLNELILNL
jgi:nitroreductase